ncbi:MAG: phosphoribosyltransferase [Pseudonocardiaceae bacterium]
MTDSEIVLDLDWAHLDRLIAVLAERIHEDGVPDLVVGILRGGMVPAVMLAHRLGVRSVRGVEVTHTTVEGPNGPKTPHPVITNPDSAGVLAGADVLLVDDVAGSGATADTATALLSRAATCVRRALVVVNVANWYAANTCAPHEVHDYIATTCAGWVRFPWELR